MHHNPTKTNDSCTHPPFLSLRRFEARKFQELTNQSLYKCTFVRSTRETICHDGEVPGQAALRDALTTHNGYIDDEADAIYGFLKDHTRLTENWAFWTYRATQEIIKVDNDDLTGFRTFLQKTTKEAELPALWHIDLDELTACHCSWKDEIADPQAEAAEDKAADGTAHPFYGDGSSSSSSASSSSSSAST